MGPYMLMPITEIQAEINSSAFLLSVVIEMAYKLGACCNLAGEVLTISRRLNYEQMLPR